ncbi:hypothetical protein LC605_31660 [Nostoc sp. CHAB 5836]|uniref:hypothetical protein n=1 Tax=Nostoc sp. CHAB 5836 TaxID=2780404 RepID=UPI001E636F95|nr:hypothetical protein [Nostoc sp. CHAB 5836]MCC5619527.1 hypothetical protein [Nostoc sp. CHAB 5836]
MQAAEFNQTKTRSLSIGDETELSRKQAEQLLGVGTTTCYRYQYLCQNKSLDKFWQNWQN